MRLKRHAGYLFIALFVVAGVVLLFWLQPPLSGRAAGITRSGPDLSLEASPQPSHFVFLPAVLRKARAGAPAASPTLTPTTTGTATSSATATAAVTTTPTASATATGTETASATPSNTLTSEPSATPSATGTNSPEPASTATATPTPAAATETPTTTPGFSSTPTPTPSPTDTSTPAPTPSPTGTATAEATGTSTPTPVPSATATPSPTPTPTTSATATASPTSTTTPKPPVGIHGQVTFQGSPAPNIAIELALYVGGRWNSSTPAATGPDGRYDFAGAQPLGPGMSYFVYFGPNTGDPRFVYEWYGPEIASYTGGVAAGGDFDIADVPLLSPPRDAQVGLPVTFAWQVRPATSTDNYSVHLSGLINPDLETDLPSAGYTGSTTMVQLPSGFSANEDYVWEVWIDGPGGTGMSFDARFITFTAAANTARK